MPLPRRTLLALLGVCLLVAPAASVSAAEPDPSGAGWQTDQPAMLDALAPGSSVQPIITVGETLPGGYMFEAIPDGIALADAGPKRAEVWVNHETSTVPFPAVGQPGAAVDFKNAELSQLTLKQHERFGIGVKKGSYAIPTTANYQRFCSNYLATAAEDFDRPLLFTNEESSDFVNRTGDAWPPGPNAEQAGVVVAYDPASGQYRSIYGMGRHNHENSVAIPGYGKPVLLSGDDTFSAPSSQVYMYIADDADAVWNDEGALYAFKSDNPAINDYGDLTRGTQVSGEFIPVPRAVAVGDQTALENWSNENGVFQFIRIEDIAYDRTSSNVVYMADTGEPRAIADPATGRLMRGPSGTQGPYPNGRIFRFELDSSDPTEVDSLSVLYDADKSGYNAPGELHQPDNLETTARSLLIQEDPGSHNQGATGARIWRYDLTTGSLSVVAEVDQSLDPAASKGAWESSGIVDASAELGPGAFLVTVQAHTLWIDQEPVDIDGDGVTDLIRKREGGQLLLFRLPDA